MADNSFVFESLPTKTYALHTESGRIYGMTDGKDAVTQAIYLILSTERFDCPIMSFNYGVELKSLIGQPRALIYSEIKRRIAEALLQDDRINGVGDFEFDETDGNIHCTFTVSTIYGSISAGKEVSI